MKKMSARLVHRYFIVALICAILLMIICMLTKIGKNKAAVDADHVTRESRSSGSNILQPASRVLIWAVPRSISTTLLISLSRSPNTQAWFEPFLFASQWERFEESAEPMSVSQIFLFAVANQFISGNYDMRKLSYDWVKEHLENQEQSTNVIVKDMVKGISENGKYAFIPNGFTHTILIRHPLKVFTSYKSKHNTEGSINKGLKLTEYSKAWIPDGYFFKEIYDLTYHLRHVLNQRVIIIDADDLLADPEGMLKGYCREVGLTFTEEMLHWEADNDMWWNWMLPRSTFLKWFWRNTRYGYNKSHMTSFSTSGFSERMDLPKKVDEDVVQLAEASMKYYNELYRHRFTVTHRLNNTHPVDFAQAKQNWQSVFFR